MKEGIALPLSQNKRHPIFLLRTLSQNKRTYKSLTTSGNKYSDFFGWAEIPVINTKRVVVVEKLMTIVKQKWMSDRCCSRKRKNENEKSAKLRKVLATLSWTRAHPGFLFSLFFLFYFFSSSFCVCFSPDFLVFLFHFFSRFCFYTFLMILCLLFFLLLIFLFIIFLQQNPSYLTFEKVLKYCGIIKEDCQGWNLFRDPPTKQGLTPPTILS